MVEEFHRGTATGAWADSRIGPARISGEVLAPARLEALAALLARR